MKTSSKNKTTLPFGAQVARLLHRAPITFHVRGPLFHWLAKTGMFQVTRIFPDGMKLALDIEDKVQMEIFLRGFWEKQQLSIVRSLMRDGDSFIDIGAHCGSFAAPIAYQFRNSKVLAFEPNPHIRKLLLKTRQINNLENLLVDARALSDDEKLMDFYVSSGATDSLAGLRSRERTPNKINVQTTTLMKALSQYQIVHARIMKMDIEGAEGVVLPSSQKILMSNSIDSLLLELHVDLIEGFGCKAEDIIQLLMTANFALYHFTNSELQPLPDNWRRYVDGSNTIHILCLKKGSIETDRLPKVT